MTDVIVWKSDTNEVAAYSVPGGMTTGAAMYAAPVPQDRPRFVKLDTQLPNDAPIGAWLLSNTGEVTVDEAKKRRLLCPGVASAGDFMRALYELGWYANVVTAVTTAGGLSKILFDRAAIFERHHPMVDSIAQAIGKTQDDLDDLFYKAATYGPAQVA